MTHSSSYPEPHSALRLLNSLTGSGFNPPYTAAGRIRDHAYVGLDLRWIDFSRREVSESFYGCDLRGADFTDCRFPKTVWINDCRMDGARFERTNLGSMQFREMPGLRDAIFKDVRWKLKCYVSDQTWSGDFHTWLKEVYLNEAYLKDRYLKDSETQVAG